MRSGRLTDHLTRASRSRRRCRVAGVASVSLDRLAANSPGHGRRIRGVPHSTSSGGPPSDGPRRLDAGEAEPVDLLDLVGGSLAKRVSRTWVVGGLLLFGAVIYALRRRRR
jgi:hypothetical protein